MSLPRPWLIRAGERRWTVTFDSVRLDCGPSCSKRTDRTKSVLRELSPERPKWEHLPVLTLATTSPERAVTIQATDKLTLFRP
jgi:hypothetical protein